MEKILLLIGTRKGAFIAASDEGWRNWKLEGPFFEGVQVNHMAWLPEGTIAAAGTCA